MSGGSSENHCVYKGSKTYFNNGLIIYVKRSLRLCSVFTKH